MRTFYVTFLLFFMLSPAMAQPIFDVTTFGAVGNGSTDNTAAIQRAIDSASAHKGTVLFPSGTFSSRTLRLKDDVTLYISQGATLKGDGTPANYPTITPLIRNFTDNYKQRSLLYAEGARNITLVGRGTLDGNGTAIGMALDMDNRPLAIRFYSCTNVRIDSLRLRNAGWWFCHLFNCDTVEVSNVDLYSHAFGNQDGFGFDNCRNVHIHDCKIDCNDDPIVLKGTAPLMSRNFLAERCTVATFSRCIKIGTETYGDFRNITFRDINVTASNFPIPLTPSAGINLSIVDGGSMDSVLIENVTINEAETPICIRLGSRGNTYTSGPPVPGPGSLRNVTIRNVKATATTATTSHITGIPGFKAENIRLENIDIILPGNQAALPAGTVIPENITGKPENDIFGTVLPSYGLFVRHVNGLVLDSVCFTLQQADGRPQLYFEDTTNVQRLDTCPPKVLSAIAPELINTPKLYPNPAKGTVYLNWPLAPVSAHLYDFTGKYLKAFDLRTGKNELDLVGIAAGLYILKAETFTAKLLVE